MALGSWGRAPGLLVSPENFDIFRGPRSHTESAPSPPLSLAAKGGLSGDALKRKSQTPSAVGVARGQALPILLAGIAEGGSPGPRPAHSAHLALRSRIPDAPGRDGTCGARPARPLQPALRDQRAHFCARCLAPPGVPRQSFPPEPRRDRAGTGFRRSRGSGAPGGPQRWQDLLAEPRRRRSAHPLGVGAVGVWGGGGRRIPGPVVRAAQPGRPARADARPCAETAPTAAGLRRGRPGPETGTGPRGKGALGSALVPCASLPSVAERHG